MLYTRTTEESGVSSRREVRIQTVEAAAAAGEEEEEVESRDYTFRIDIKGKP